MKKFENLKRLPDVLDDIHRRAIIDTMGKFGVELAVSASWDEVGAAVKAKEEVHNSFSLASVEYDSKDSFGPLVAAYHRLGDSGTTLYAERRLNILGGPYKLERWHRELNLVDDRTGSPSAKLFITPDSPPFVVHVDDHDYIERISPDDFETLRPTEIAGKIRQAFGEEAVELVNDDTAGDIIATLTRASAHSAEV